MAAKGELPREKPVYDHPETIEIDPMVHVIAATRREYQKMGKLLVENDFGEYFDLVKSEARV